MISALRFLERIQTHISPQVVGLLTFGVLLASSYNGLCNAQYIGFGTCPRVFGMRDFNITKYEGIWYEMEKYFFLPEATLSCVTVNYTDKHDGTFAEDLIVYEKLTGRKWRLPTIYTADSRKGSYFATMLGTFSPIPFRIRWPIRFLDTDYKTYVIKWQCKSVGLLNLQTLWIMSRSREYSHETSELVHHKLAKLGIDPTRLRKSDQNACPEMIE